MTQRLRSTLGVLFGVAALGVGTIAGFTASEVRVFAANQASPALSANREQRLRLRVESWYDSRKRRDQRAMYKLLEPSYRSKVDFDGYANLTAIRLRFPLISYAIASVTGDGPHAAAIVDMRLVMNLSRFGETEVASLDQWVWRAGNWWMVFKPFEPPIPKAGAQSVHVRACTLVARPVPGTAETGCGAAPVCEITSGVECIRTSQVLPPS